MRTGLALSGGGVRGAAHIGVLQALEEKEIEICAISGTSSGAVVASLFAAGYTPAELREIFLTFDTGAAADGFPPDLFDPDILGLLRAPAQLLLHRPLRLQGLIKGARLEKLLRQLFEAKGITRMCELPLPLAVPAVDIANAGTVMFVSRAGLGPLPDTDYAADAFPWEAVRASCAFPGVFRPKVWHGRTLCDGGIICNLPDRVLRVFGADRLISVNLGYCGQHKRGLHNLLDYSSQALNIMSYEITRCVSGPDCLTILPKIYDVGLLELDRIGECIERGYLAAKEALKRF